MGLIIGNIIQANEDFEALFTLPGGDTRVPMAISQGKFYEVSGIDLEQEIYFLIENNGPGAEIFFSDESKFTKL